MHCAFRYVNSLKVCIPHCSSTTATSRKQVTNHMLHFFLILLPQFSNHLHESCYTRYIWRVNVHDIWFARFGLGVPELCPFLKLSYPYRESKFLKLLQQFSSHLYDFSWFSLDNVEIWDTHISDSSIFNRYIIIVNIYSNFNNLHITCTSSRHSFFTHLGSNFYSQSCLSYSKKVVS